jgi:hypothetical protein
MCTQERTGDEIDTDLTRRLGIDGAAAAWVGGRRHKGRARASTEADSTSSQRHRDGLG